MAYKILQRRWLLRPYMWAIFPLELAGLITVLVLFGIAQPDLYRTKLWEVGHAYGFNSSPNIILYAYANFEPLPKIPLVWTRTLTDFNVALSVITLFLLLTKLVCFIMKFWFPLLAVIINVCMVAMYTVSVYGQMGPDHADPRYPSSIAWYISKPCSLGRPFKAEKSCQLAKGTFAATVYMLAIFIASLGIAVYVCLPNKWDKMDDEEEGAAGSDSNSSPVDPKEREWELHNMKGPATPRVVPYTPRTMAFHTLDRKLPLRQQYG
ncbi:uncharacterized protein CTRU02_209996 [Colletotrichum truncatum]|uniref:Uncharacterized protein n=1 Tax=Colletotrichum truncatum TaxID=5467 RepID=A0ACC3YTZ7_COLTU|nr:uncharacterized protein CTRU02_02571 [Colletotrichum truncatum]KAF6798597.1 hypothetical protein CTRU02_02571 [Colletotrichum truncatum]